MQTCRNLFKFIAILLCMLVIHQSVYSQAGNKKAEKEQRKKEKQEQRALEKANKKPFDWYDVRPSELSKSENMKDMNAYILYCDTIWNRIQDYKSEVAFFSVDTVEIYLESGEPGYAVKILDQEGNPKNFSRSLQQGLNLTFSGTSIVLDAALITTMATNAGLNLISDPLATFTYGKSLKGGPEIVKIAYSEIKEIVEMKKIENNAIKALRGSKLDGSTDQTYILPCRDNECDNEISRTNWENIELGTSDDEVDLSSLENIILEEIP